MRILQIVTYVSSDGAFGGPVAVATAQSQALAEAGHDVTLIGGWDGHADLEVPGVEVKLFHARPRTARLGFSSLLAPLLLIFALRNARRFDIVHIHMARDLITLPAAVFCGARSAPTVLQTHGMVVQDPRLVARLLDKLVVSRVARGAAALLALNRAEAAQLSKLFPTVEMTVLINGVSEAPCRASGPAAQPDVLFASRLHPRKRPENFVRMAKLLHDRGFPARYSLVGPDGGSLGPVEKEIDRCGLAGIVVYEGARKPELIRDRMSHADVFVLPSVNEPFPMALLEAMSVGLPCVITDSTGVSALLRSHRGAAVTDGSPEQLAAAVEEILSSPEVWQRYSDAALDVAAAHFSIKAVAARLANIYFRAAGEGRLVDSDPLE